VNYLNVLNTHRPQKMIPFRILHVGTVGDAPAISIQMFTQNVIVSGLF
jgi:hypothetical protein